MTEQPDNGGMTIDAPPEREVVVVNDPRTTLPPQGGDETVDRTAVTESLSEQNFSLSGATVSVAIDAVGAAQFEGDEVRTPSLATIAAPPGYEILRILGRGGMGVVYEARQIALRRRVALKMVTAGVHADQLQFTRFQIEAQSVAALQHPHIVQIYEVGEHNGIPFFSLELVEGGSLDSRIRHEPMSPPEAAEMVARLADAMHYAHQHGIVHRDLKPGNVLLTIDGQPKISDFGLAKRMDGAIESSQTQAGTILGTPNFMAPEQAAGDVAQVGPSADVYALGATLYRLIAGRPPHSGATLLETLEAVRTKEPTPLRQLQPRTPRDLETICLTCLQKQPSRRYSDAGALARDLRHFLAGEPIEARPVGSLERAWRWCRRHPAVATLSALVFALLTTVAVTSSVLAYRIDQEKQQTEIERQAADDARDVAQKNAVLALEAQKKAEENEKKAKENAETAVQQSKIALGALGTLIDKVQEQIGDNPGMQALKAKLLETALEQLDKVAKSDEDKRLHSQYIAGAYMKLGNLFRQLGQSEKAFNQYVKCHEIIKSMVERDAERAEVNRDNMASTFTVLGEMSRELKHDLRGALDYYRQALDIRKDLTSRPLKQPDKLDPVKLRGRLAESYTRVGIAHLLLGEPALALGNFEQAKSIRQELVNQAPTGTTAEIAAARSLRLDLARSYNALGEARLRNREWAAARADFAQALAVGEAVHREDPKNPTYRFELGNTLGNIGLFEVRAGQLDDASRHYDRFRQIAQELADLDPKNTFYQRSLGLANYRSGALARRQNNSESARTFDQKCLQIREQLAAADAKSDRRRIELMLVRPRCGQHVQAAEDADRLFSSSSTTPPDREVLVEMAQCYAQCAAAVTNDSSLRATYVQKALDALNKALDQGFKDVVILETEPDLDALREEPRFQSILDRLRTG